MTREEAIKWVKFVHDVLYEDKDEDIRKALGMAIYALMREQQFMYNASQGTTTILKIENRHFEVRERMI